MRRSHGRALIAAMVVLAPLTAAPTASAATTVGQSPPTTGTAFECGPTNPGDLIDVAQLGSVSGNSYVVPAGGGVITRWRSFVTSGSLAMKLRLFNGNTLAIQPVAESALVTLAPGGPGEFFSRIPAAGGEALGFTFAGQGGGCFHQNTPSAGDLLAGAFSGPVGGTEPVILTANNQMINIAADLEPDADRDGFGDESQDATITKNPKRKTSSSKATFRFVGSASFQCKLDGGNFKACTSPKKFKKLDSGKHRFQVRAVTPTNELSPAAKFAWRIKG